MSDKVFFNDVDGNNVCGVLSNFSKNKVYILTHGLTSGKDGWTTSLLQQNLNKKKISSIRIDLYAHGESDGTYEQLTITKAVNSVMATVDFLKSKGYNDIGLYGSSFGGIVSIMAMQKHNFFCLALKCPVSDYFVLEKEHLGQLDKDTLKEWKEKGVKQHGDITLGYCFYEDFEPNQPYKIAHNITVPVLIVHGSADTVVPVEQSIKLNKLLPNSKLEIIMGANHIFERPEDFNESVTLLTEFLVKEY